MTVADSVVQRQLVSKVAALEAGVMAPAVTSLPANPVDGQECSFVADATAGVAWRFKYRAGSPSALKWEFIGGSELVSGVTQQTIIAAIANSTTPFTPKCKVTVPLAGDYMVAITANRVLKSGAALNTYYFWITLAGGATAFSLAGDVMYTSLLNTGAFASAPAAHIDRVAGCVAGQAIELGYYHTNNTSGIQHNVMMQVRPVRVG